MLQAYAILMQRQNNRSLTWGKDELLNDIRYEGYAVYLKIYAKISE